MRWSDGYGGAWSPEIIVFTGSGAVRAFAADEQERVVIDRQTVEQCRCFDAVLAYFAAADFAVPPLHVAGATA
ncbi:hypothetical protein [Stakelama saccharophila]|uniref:Uncharacterized protein n=1 Tax=Stakelama saccharophila TaxID=3075605 RepID=A0ABZ0B7S1_9SPHN|nr:hypothetical protein [Stakelama sp. W311]WNO53466.1 hypothetical protein RPR59_13625 [Stakelama sp. W311]